MALPGLFGGQQQGDGGQSPLMALLTGVLAAVGGTGASTAQPQQSSGVIGILGSLLGGAGGGGGILSSGLQQLLTGFQQSGQGDKAESWVSTGPNKSIAPHEVGQALGEDRVQSLTQQTGMPRDQLLSQLSASLPEFVNMLTPNGRIPTQQEAAKYVH